MAMAFLFFAAYGLARVASNVVLADRRGAETFHQWVQALTNNQVLDLAAGSLYAAAAAHLAVGVLAAILYGYYFEPRLAGAGWLKGFQFSLIPWFLSLVVFLPLVGGGLFGFAIGAGPLPAIGNLVLHLVYGITLGAMYGPVGDIAADEFPHRGLADEPEVVARYERAAARGIVAGAIVGLIAGIVLAMQAVAPSMPIPFGVPAAALPPMMAVIGATFGGVLGSITGLAPGSERRESGEPSAPDREAAPQAYRDAA